MSNSYTEALAMTQAGYGDSFGGAVGIPRSPFRNREDMEKAAARLETRLGSPSSETWMDILSKHNTITTIPPELLGNNTQINMIVVSGLSERAKQAYFTSIVAPLRFVSGDRMYSEGIKIEYNEIVYDRFPAAPIGPLSPVPLIGYSQTKRTEIINAFGIGFFEEMFALMSKSGARRFDFRMEQIVTSFVDRLQIEIVRKLAIADQVREEMSIPMRMGLGKDVTRPRDALREQALWFSYFTKVEHPYPAIAKRGRKIVHDMCKLYPNVVIVAPGIREYVQEAPENTYEYLGDKVFPQRYSTVESNEDLIGFTSKRFGLLPIESPDIVTGEYSPPLNRLINARTVGQYFLMDFSNMSDPGKLDPKYAGLVVMDYNNDMPTLITASSAFRATGIWDGKGLITPYGQQYFSGANTWGDALTEPELARLSRDLAKASSAPGKPAANNPFIQWAQTQKVYTSVGNESARDESLLQAWGGGRSGEDFREHEYMRMFDNPPPQQQQQQPAEAQQQQPAEAQAQEDVGATGTSGDRRRRGMYSGSSHIGDSSGARRQLYSGTGMTDDDNPSGTSGDRRRRGTYYDDIGDVTKRRRGGGGTMYSGSPYIGDSNAARRQLYSGMGMTDHEINRLMGTRGSSVETGAKEELRDSLVDAMMWKRSQLENYNMGAPTRAVGAELMRNRVREVGDMITRAADKQQVFIMGNVLVKISGIVDSPGGVYFEPVAGELDDITKEMVETMKRAHAEASAMSESDQEFDRDASRRQISILWDRTRQAQRNLEDALRAYVRDSESGYTGARLNIDPYDPSIRSGNRHTMTHGFDDEADMEEIGTLLDRAARESGDEQYLRRIYNEMAVNYIQRKSRTLATEFVAFAKTMDRYLKRMLRENIEDGSSMRRLTARGRITGNRYKGVREMENISSDYKTAMSFSEELRGMHDTVVQDVTEELMEMDPPEDAFGAFKAALHVVRAALDLGIHSGPNMAVPSLLKAKLMDTTHGSAAIIDLTDKVWGDDNDDHERVRRLNIKNLASRSAVAVNNELKQAKTNFISCYDGSHTISKQEIALTVLVAVELATFSKHPSSMTPVRGIFNTVMLAGSSDFASRYRDESGPVMNRNGLLPDGSKTGILRVGDDQDLRVRAKMATSDMWVELNLTISVVSPNGDEYDGPSTIIVSGSADRYRMSSRGETQAITGVRHSDIVRIAQPKLREQELQAIQSGLSAFVWAESGQDGSPVGLVPAAFVILYLTTKGRHEGVADDSEKFKRFTKNMRLLASETNATPTKDGLDRGADLDEDEDDEDMPQGDVLDHTDKTVADSNLVDGGQNSPDDETKKAYGLRRIMWLVNTDAGRTGFVQWMSKNETDTPSFLDYMNGNFEKGKYDAAVALVTSGRTPPPTVEKGRVDAVSGAQGGGGGQGGAARSEIEATRDIMAVLRILAVDDDGLIHKCIELGVRPPINVLLFRPHVTWFMKSMIFMNTDGAMNSVIANVQNGVSYDATHHAVRGSVRGMIGSYISKPKQIFTMPNVMCDRYVRGGGIRMANNSDPMDIRAYKSGSPDFNKDIFAVPVPTDWKPSTDALDITGHFNDALHDLMVEDDYQRAHSHQELYPGGSEFSRRWGFTPGHDQLMNSFQKLLKPGFRILSGSNSLVMKGPAMMFNSNGKFDTPGCRIVGTSHLGDSIFPGKRSMLEGNMKPMRAEGKTQAMLNVAVPCV